MGKSLVIVESPAKARTISRFLGRDFLVKASVGHIRDLPRHRLGISLDDRFEQEYVTIPGKAKIVSELRKSAQDADRILLAADPDREGEAICWHLASVLEDVNPRIERILFHEITRRAIEQALQSVRAVDQHKVESQFARRVLDRIVGYRLSPLLWKKIRRGLSAGRVQSVALRILVDRERAIEAFVPEEYWVIQAELAAGAPPLFRVRLALIDGRKAVVRDGRTAEAIVAELRSGDFRVAGLERKQQTRRPVPPFITSTLQQEAARRLGLPAQRTMKIAQSLYEGKDLGEGGRVGLITYMRTDSPRASEESVQAVRGYIQARYGERYLPARPPRYASAKGAQEAHEAIRPTSLELAPDVVSQFLARDELRLYTLIWNGFVASQMAPALSEVTTVDVACGRHTLRAQGIVPIFDGFQVVYSEGKDDTGSRDDGRDEDDETGPLPPLTEGEVLALRQAAGEQRFTRPPPRFTEATLVKALEERGIGRPSTYATILSILRDRDYATLDKKRFRPTDLGKSVVDLLVAGFPRLLDERFTAAMESNLDGIEEGEREWRSLVGEFYQEFSADLARAEKELPVLRAQVEVTTVPCPVCTSPMTVKSGRAGRFLACSRYPDCKGKLEFETGPEGEIVPAATPAPVKPCPKCGSDMVIRKGRFGRFLACTGYPRCKHTEPIATGVACPREGCGGQLVERQGRGGRTFYSCSRYPECKTTVWSPPVPRPCPACGHPFLVLQKGPAGKRQLACPRTGCGHREDAPEDVHE